MADYFKKRSEHLIMEYGILTDKEFRALFEEINKRRECRDCRNKREKKGCAINDLKVSSDKGDKNKYYSNMLVGFSSKKVRRPLDMLVVALEHGGGESKDFNKRYHNYVQDLDEEVQSLGNYYLQDPIKKYHQFEMRKLFDQLDASGRSWVFADLFRCYLDNKKTNKENKKIAQEHCGKYLKEEINFLKPRIVLCLGAGVHEYFQDKSKIDHGNFLELERLKSILPASSVCLSSYFPSRQTADIWVRKKGWDPVMFKINEYLKE